MRPLLVGCSAILTAALACQPSRDHPFLMRWHIEADRTCPRMRHVILTFADYPAYSYGLCSNQVADYLESRGGDTVTVVFAVFEPEAQLGGGNPERIGTLSRWRSEFVHSGTNGSVDPGSRHPWDVFREPRP